MARNCWFSSLCLLLLLVFIASCGNDHKVQSTVKTDSALTQSNISVQVFNEQGEVICNPDRDYKLVVTNTNDSRIVSISTTKQITTLSNYLKVTFNPATEYPAETDFGSALDKYQTLKYSGSPEAGSLICAQVVIGDKPIAEKGELLKITFKPGKHIVRATSGFNQDPQFDPILTNVLLDKSDSSKVYWTIKLRGDGNNNQLFDFADFGVIGSKYNQKRSVKPETEVADGSNNSVVDFADFGVVGANYNKGIGGLKVYRDVVSPPTTLLGVLDTSGKLSGDFKIDAGANKALSSGFKQYWHTFTGSGDNYVLVLLDLKGNVISQSGNSTNKSEWWMFGKEPTHNGRSRMIGPATNAKNWDCLVEGSIASSPVIGADGTIYVGRYSSRGLVAINKDGSIKWTFDTGGIVATSPALDPDGNIYIGSNDGSDSKLYSVNPEGSKNWEFAVTDDIDSSAVIAPDGTIYVGCNDKKLYSVKPDGTKNWEITTGGKIVSSPAISPDGTIYFGSNDFRFYAINPNSTQKWVFKTEGAIEASPAIGPDGTIYAGSYDGTLYAINPDGSKKWSKKVGGEVYNGPVIGTDGSIYIGSQGWQLYSISPIGSTNWTFTTSSLIKSSPAIGADGTIYIADAAKKLFAVNPDGTQKWEYETDADMYSASPAIGPDGSILIGTYYGTFTNKLISIGPGAGKSGLMPPTGVAASDATDADKVVISWVAPSSGPVPDGYYIYQSLSSSGIWLYIGKSTSTTYEDTTAQTGLTYYYKVQSYKFASGYNDSVDSAIDTGAKK